MNITTEKKAKRPYRWGAYDALRDMEPMTVAVVGSGERDKAAGFRQAASRLTRNFGAEYSIRWREGVIYAVRYE